MSTATPSSADLGRQGKSAPTTASLDARDVGTSSVHSGAVENARREIQTLAREIAELTRSGLEPHQFYEAMLSRVVSALGAVGGAVWTYGPAADFQLAYQINLPQSQLAGELENLQHAQLLHEVAAEANARLVLPNAGPIGDGAANPTNLVLVFGVLAADAGVEGIVEIFQRPDTSPVAQRGYVRFVSQMCELASDYLKERKLRDFSHKQSLWEHLDNFARAAHATLDVRQTAFTIANEGRRLIGCDRVSVAVRHGRHARLEAISGQDTFERRAQQIRLLEALIAAVTKTGEPLWYAGERAELAPQVERALDAYVDVAHARFVAIVPLTRGTVQGDASAETSAASSATTDAQMQKQEIVGALVVEQLADGLPEASLRRRIEVVADHSGGALANARQYHQIFLLSLWQTLGRARWVVSARTLPKTLLALGIVGGAAAALMLVPAELQLEARGTLQPVMRREVFAGIDGVVVDVPVEHGQRVATGDLLATLRNTDLEVEITDVLGRRESTVKQIRSIERALLGENRLTIEEQNRLSGQLVQLRKTYESLDRQLELYRQKEEQLQVKSPIEGQIVTWQVRDQLARRPVRQGQILMSVANPRGPWELEVYMPEDRMGHVAEAAAQNQTPLRVSYILATQPGVSHQGTVVEVHGAAELRGEQGNTVLLRVAMDDPPTADYRPGASVTAKVACGQHSLGYVWLHDLVAFVQRKILFRL